MQLLYLGVSTSHTTQLNREIKQGKLNRKKRNNKIKEIKILKKVIMQINKKCPFCVIAKLNVSVSQFWGLALSSPFGFVFGPFTTPDFIVSLEGRKKERERKEKKKASC